MTSLIYLRKSIRHLIMFLSVNRFIIRKIEVLFKDETNISNILLWIVLSTFYHTEFYLFGRIKETCLIIILFFIAFVWRRCNWLFFKNSSIQFINAIFITNIKNVIVLMKEEELHGNDSSKNRYCEMNEGNNF